MRYPPKHREEARERIVSAASHAVRERGLAEASVAYIMGRAGLTHGAFYHHFADRDALLVAAVSAAAAETAERVFAGDATRRSMLEAYCSAEHVASPQLGCILAALGTEATHHDARSVRAAFTTAARGFIRHVARVVRGTGRSGRDIDTSAHSDAGKVDDEALSLASRMIGAVVLARLVDDRRLAKRILEVARR